MNSSLRRKACAALAVACLCSFALPAFAFVGGGVLLLRPLLHPFIHQRLAVVVLRRRLLSGSAQLSLRFPSWLPRRHVPYQHQLPHRLPSLEPG